LSLPIILNGKLLQGDDIKKQEKLIKSEMFEQSKGKVIGTAVLQFLLVFGGTITLAQPTSNIFTYTHDASGIRKLYGADTAKSPLFDWDNNWSGSLRTLTTSYTSDPQDPQTFFLGSSAGGITIGQDRLVLRAGQPRLYINKQSSSPGFENVEFTAYANYMVSGGESSLAGFTMIARSDHFLYKTVPGANPCNAVAYYVRIWEGTGNTRGGQVSFSKEYYHDGSTTVYASAVYTPLFSTFPKNQWIGMKLVVYTIPGTQNVQLEFWLDLTDGLNGGDWNLVHSYVDRPGEWLSPQTVPAACPLQNGDTVLGGRASCTLRADGGEVHWKKASARHIVPTRITPKPTRRPTSKPIAKPTGKPTKRPTRRPTRKPTKHPTVKPSLRPTARPIS
jgi:hypothetical protein